MKYIITEENYEQTVIDDAVLAIMARHDVGEKLARQLLFNALAHAIVQDELMGAIDWLMDVPEGSE